MSISPSAVASLGGSLSRLVDRVLAFARRGRASVGHQPCAVDDARHVQVLRKHGIQSMVRPVGHKIECLAGCLWITHDGDPKDIVLRAGESYVPDRHSRLLVQALEDAQLRVRLA